MPEHTPLLWFGSKSRQLKGLRLALPETFDYLIEPFVGSAAFSLAMIEDGFIDASNVWMNDKNPTLMNFWSTFRDNQAELSAKMWDVFDEHGFGDEALFLKSFDEAYHPDSSQINIAKAHYILNRLTYAGKAPTKSNYCNPFKTGAGIRPRELNRFPRFSELVQGTKHTCLDYREIEPLTANTLIYLDSPYCQNGGVTPDWDIYGVDNTIIEQEYIEYCEALRDKCQLLISYGDSPNAIKCFDGWNVYRIPVCRTAGKQVNQTELLITNYDIPYVDMLCDEWELAA